MATTASLALFGGERVRKTKMPGRRALGDDERARLLSAIEYYQGRGEDPPYQGVFERQFCDAFADFMGGGFADAVATGTAAIYVALAALELPRGSEVIISPATDSGPLNSIILQGLVPVVADSEPDSYNMGVEQFLDRVTPRTSAVLAVHCAGQPLAIDAITEEARKCGIRVLEDCSQAPGARWNGRLVGTFGDVAAFSTMYRKTLMTSSSGGVVYARDPNVYRRALAHADRGKPVWRIDVNLNDPGHALFPALNFNTDEFSCAIGLGSLARLQDAIDGRVRFVSTLIDLLGRESRVCRPYAFHDGFSPFFLPIFVDVGRLTCSKVEFAQAVAAEGIDLNVHYGCVIGAWEWAVPYLPGGCATPNALSTRDRSFNLFLNERYGPEEARDVVAAIGKVEAYFLR